MGCRGPAAKLKTHLTQYSLERAFASRGGGAALEGVVDG